MPLWSTACVVVAAIATLAAALACQERERGQEQAGRETLDNGLGVHRVPVVGAKQTCFALAFKTGWRHDPKGATGLHETLRWLLVYSQKDVPMAERWTVEVQPHLTLLTHHAPAAKALRRLQFVLDLMDGSLRVSEDLRALATGRARLEADNNSWLVPGKILRQKAWRKLLAGTPSGRRSFGIPEEIGALSLATLRRRVKGQFTADGASLAVLGACDESLWRGICARLTKLPRSMVADRVSDGLVHDSAPPLVARAPHARIGGPFVSASFAAVAPGEAEHPAFVVAMLLLRQRAYETFGKYRRGEAAAAEFPFLAYRPNRGDLIARVNRRGRNGSDPTAARREIEDLLDSARRGRVHDAELGTVRREAATLFRDPPYRRHSHYYLVERARYLATARCCGWPDALPAALQAVTAEQVARVFRVHLEASRLAWFELLRVKRKSDLPKGWRR